MFAEGQNGYTERGVECVYICEVPARGHLVRIYFEAEGYDGHIYEDDREEIVKKFFTKPPMDKVAKRYADEVALLEKARQQRQKLEDEKRNLRNEIKDIDSKLTSVRQELENVEAFRPLLDYRNHEYKYGVVSNWSVPIFQVTSIYSSENFRSDVVVASLTLSGYNRKAVWKVESENRNNYSNDMQTVLAPFKTKEEAVCFIKKKLYERPLEGRDRKWIDTLVHYGFEPDPETELFVKSKEIKTQQTAYDNCLQKVKEAKARLDELSLAEPAKSEGAA